MVPVCTVPKLYGEGVTVRIGAATCFPWVSSKSAATDCGPLMFTEQVPPAEQAPLQDVNVDPGAGTAVRVTVESWGKLNAHCGAQLIPIGMLFTVPVPNPVTVMIKGCTKSNSAPTVTGEFTVRVHGAIPAQKAEFHPANPDPPAGFAVSVTEVPFLKVKPQVLPQSIPAGVLVTLPLPLPEGATVSAAFCPGVIGAKLAVTELSPFKVTLQPAVPEQAPPQFVNP